jgi:hypothetical protein
MGLLGRRKVKKAKGEIHMGPDLDIQYDWLIPISGIWAVIKRIFGRKGEKP